jgi:hypothetical protein
MGFVEKEQFGGLELGLIICCGLVFGGAASAKSADFRREVAMQGVHAFDPKVKTTIDLESFVSENHFRRRNDRVPCPPIGPS